jgi:hypothetical protein
MAYAQREFVAEVRENPSLRQCCHPRLWPISVASVDAQRETPSTVQLAADTSAWNRISHEIRASNLCRLAQRIRAIARALPIVSRTDRPKSSFAVYLGRNVDPRSAIRWGSRIPLAALMSLIHVARLSLLFDKDALSNWIRATPRLCLSTG